MKNPNHPDPRKAPVSGRRVAPLPFDVAQDLKNVLLTIVGSTELMMESIGGDLNLKVHAAKILRASREGAALIESLDSRSNDSDSKDSHSHDAHSRKDSSLEKALYGQAASGRSKKRIPMHPKKRAPQRGPKPLA